MPLTLADLAADPENPRAIDEEAAEALGESLAAFGDISGIVFNRRTGELVCGHQRVGELIALAGDADVAIHVEGGEFAWLEIGDERYDVRLVDWSRAKQRAANLAGNNQQLRGTFTNPEAYLAPVRHELGELYDDVGLALMMPAAAAELAAVEEWTVVVDCLTEDEQRKLYEELRERGVAVKLVTM